MGYYTYYNLELKPLKDEHIPQCEHPNPDGATFCMTCGKQIKNMPMPVTDFVWEYITTAPEMDYVEHAVGKYGGGGSCKWYNHEDDMKFLSAKFPGVLFILSGEGEGADDLWVEYWHNGRVQVERAKITYGKFDPAKLTEHK